MHFHFLFFALCLCIFAGVFLFQCLCLLLGFTHYLFFGVSHDLLTDLPSAHPVLISLCAAWVDRKIRELQMRNRETAVVNLSLLAVTPNEVVFIVKEERLLIFSLNAYAICSGDAHNHCISQSVVFSHVFGDANLLPCFYQSILRPAVSEMAICS